ncbi:hypothetical protein [Accumulibacter sp.]|uniref:hypothetical protein n=1 Tax=Accumulibacter sp. TaxID=2053492 RepID=UPI0025F017AE|nr:hypothetical protein [Accumulibacter sp.]MCM8593995.1 hypothetical protein [Accumulibacter sp.]MCM8624812.1 hypothetical protein [Accumulibacter sp.]MDS4048137.1 hypothetical protein [Accumulibacter sp.]
MSLVARRKATLCRISARAGRPRRTAAHRTLATSARRVAERLHGPATTRERPARTVIAEHCELHNAKPAAAPILDPHRPLAA